MAYEDSSIRRQDADLTETVAQSRLAPAEDARFYPGVPRQASYAAPAPAPLPTAAAPPAAALDDVFDDPAAGEPGRDRLLVHWVWELLLLVGVVALAILIWQAQSDALRGQGLSQLLVFAAGYGLIAVATGLTLRAGAVNLAVGPVAAAAGVYFAQQGAEGVMTATVVALAWAAALGVVIAVLVVGLHVPGWAASLAGAGGVVVWLHQQPAQVPLAGAFDPTSRAPLLFVMVVAVAIVGGLVGTAKPVRRALGRFRPVGDPARRRGVLAAVLTGGALLISMLFAVIGGVLLASGTGEPVPGSAGTRWLELTVFGLAAVLLGGTSVFGRRGGVFGTVLAVLALVLFDTYQHVQGWAIALLATAAVGLVGGLLVTRMVERFGRPRSADEDQKDWIDGPTGVSPDPLGSVMPADDWVGGADSWGSSLPAKPVRAHPPTWGDGWGR